jgi:hypothetical protein
MRTRPKRVVSKSPILFEIQPAKGFFRMQYNKSYRILSFSCFYFSVFWRTAITIAVLSLVSVLEQLTNCLQVAQPGSI